MNINTTNQIPIPNPDNMKGEPFFVVHSGSWMWNETQIHCKETHVDMAVVLSKEDNEEIRGLAFNNTVWIEIGRASCRERV